MNKRKSVEKWLKEIIINLNLCPFAKEPFEKGLIRISNSLSVDEKEMITFFLDELSLLQSKKKSEISTSLISFENFKGSFQNFLDLVGVFEDILTDLKLDEIFQLVCFHPDFQFEGLEIQNRANYVNRSPIPLVHLLRFEEVDLVVQSPEQGQEISFANEKKLNQLSSKDFDKYFS